MCINMNWPQLLNWNRLCEDRTGPFLPERSPFQVDYDRLVFSSPFRRLQDKTQVFPLSHSDYVRTRLTHTVEVSTVARTLGTSAGNFLRKKYGDAPINDGGTPRNLADVIKAADIGSVVAAAALAHDIGNPPFGHSGEDAVRHWFATSPLLEEAKKTLLPAQMADFANWEGNAQGFRILSVLQLYKRPEKGGMRLTYATLGAFCKYPTYSASILAKSDSQVSRKKFGIFQSETSHFEDVASNTNMMANGAALHAWCRHPLAFLMEAADDICYKIVDLEDGVRLRLIPFSTGFELLKQFAEEKDKRHVEIIIGEPEKIAYLRAVAIRKLVREVAQAFEHNESKILDGTFNTPLVGTIGSAPLLKQFDEPMALVYKSSGVLELEAAGFQIIPGLLDLYWSAVSDPDSNRRARKIKDLMPQDLRIVADDRGATAYERLLAICDYVTGMTDSYALNMYRKLNGIALPS